MKDVRVLIALACAAAMMPLSAQASTIARANNGGNGTFPSATAQFLGFVVDQDAGTAIVNTSSANQLSNWQSPAVVSSAYAGITHFDFDGSGISNQLMTGSAFTRSLSSAASHSWNVGSGPFNSIISRNDAGGDQSVMTSIPLPDPLAMAGVGLFCIAAVGMTRRSMLG